MFRGKLLSLVLAITMVLTLLPICHTAFATTGTITSIIVNPNRPTVNSGSTRIRVADSSPVSGSFIYGDKNYMTIAHMGAALKGKTQILLPEADSNRTNTTEMSNFLHSQQEYFNFTANQPGAVYVLSGLNLHNNTNPSYINNYASWTCVTSNVMPSFPDGQTNWRLVDYNYEPADAPYYLSRLQWSSAATVNANPQTTTNCISSTNYKYCYKKYFAANTPVSIPVIGNFNWNENVVILVDWDDIESANVKLSSLTYTPNGGTTASVTGFTQTDEGGIYNVILPYGTTSASVGATAAGSNAIVTKDPENGVVDVTRGIGSCIVTVESSGLIKTFTVNFNVSTLSSNASLSNLTYTEDGGSAIAITDFLPTDNGGIYSAVLSEGVLSVSLQGVVADTGRANITYDKAALTSFPGSITATVTAEDNTQKTFKVNFDVPGYILYDDFDGHGDVGTLISTNLGGWSYASATKEGTDYVEYVTIGIDPKNPDNKVAKYQYNNVLKHPALKKNLDFTQTVVFSGEVLLDKINGPSSYFDFRKLNGTATQSAGTALAFSKGGGIAVKGANTTEYKWVAGEWIKFTLAVVPNSTDMTKCIIRVLVTGGVTDINGNPVVLSCQSEMDLSKTEYLTTNKLTVVYNSLLSDGSNDAIYLDNARIYNPKYGDVNADGTINISDVIMAAEIAVGTTGFTDEEKSRANVSSKNDITVDISDVVLIIERAVGGTMPFPINKP